jgi:putative DNA primase/helicase
VDNPEYAQRVDAARRAAHGRWTEILRAQGLDERMLLRKPMACPLCRAGVDRFQYTDKFGEGNYHCRKCGPGGGFKLLQACKGQDFHAALVAVESLLGSLPVAPVAMAGATPAPSPERMRALAQRIWDEARPVSAGDAVDRYLQSRSLGLAVYPPALRCHPALGYFRKDGGPRARKVADYPAMLASVQSPQGLVTLHRTYLTDGHKLDAQDARKLLSGGYVGASVPLAEATDELAVCEGLETGLAVLLATGKPVWCALGAGNLEKLWVPPTVRRVCIYADNDADGDFTGQASAYALARRLRREPGEAAPREVQVYLPKAAGSDWADVWRQRQQAALLRAA